jgi:dihydroorotase
MNKMLITGGRVIDPANKIDEILDVLIEDGRVKKIGKGITEKGAVEFDAKSLVVAPGFIDMHVHLREPGREEEETIASGAAAAVAGGFTSIAAMPNTEPAVDNEAAAAFVILQGKKANLARVFPVGSITHGRDGQRLSEMGGLVRGGAVAFSDDGDSVRSAEIMRRGLLYAKMFDKVIIEHCEDKDLSGGGVMNSGFESTRLGLSGNPAASEEIMVARDITLAGITGGRLHVAHVSTAGSVELVRSAKKRGLKVSCETTPHHICLTDECVRTFDANYKMNPPLRTKADIEAVKAGLADGTIDAIASDHAPHTPEEKDNVFSFTPDGVIGMETALGVAVTELVEKNILTLPQLIEKFTVNPAKILGLPHGTLTPGVQADITIFDPKAKWTVDTSAFRSKSRNCPFGGMELTGKAVCTIVGGLMAYRLEN